MYPPLKCGMVHLQLNGPEETGLQKRRKADAMGTIEFPAQPFEVPFRRRNDRSFSREVNHAGAHYGSLGRRLRDETGERRYDC